jgi:protein gp37
MALAPQHDFQVLTKRAERMRQYMADLPIASAPGRIGRLLHALSAAHNGDAFKLWQAQDRLINWPLPNVMLGVSVEDQTRADERIPLLLDTPAARRFISAEPLIGPVRLRETLSSDGRGDWLASGLSGERRGLDLVIIGGESGPNARPFNIGWARDLINQCKPAGVACFVKQLGAVPIADRRPEFHASLGRDYQIYLKDKKGGDWSEWPPNLRVREFSA